MNKKLKQLECECEFSNKENSKLNYKCEKLLSSLLKKEAENVKLSRENHSLEKSLEKVKSCLVFTVLVLSFGLMISYI